MFAKGTDCMKKRKGNVNNGQSCYGIEEYFWNRYRYKKARKVNHSKESNKWHSERRSCCCKITLLYNVLGNVEVVDWYISATPLCYSQVVIIILKESLTLKRQSLWIWFLLLIEVKWRDAKEEAHFKLPSFLGGTLKYRAGFLRLKFVFLNTY